MMPMLTAKNRTQEWEVSLLSSAVGRRGLWLPPQLEAEQRPELRMYEASDRSPRCGLQSRGRESRVSYLQSPFRSKVLRTQDLDPDSRELQSGFRPDQSGQKQ